VTSAVFELLCHKKKKWAKFWMFLEVQHPFAAKFDNNNPHYYCNIIKKQLSVKKFLHYSLYLWSRDKTTLLEHTDHNSTHYFGSGWKCKFSLQEEKLNEVQNRNYLNLLLLHGYIVLVCTVNHTQAHQVRICRHNTDNVCTDTHSWTRPVILAKLWL